MCLLVFAWQTEPGYALVVAANNRDEQLDRAAHPLCVLRESNPRILGGRDDLAGGTWLAVNDHGVVAGLTNRPSPGGRALGYAQQSGLESPVPVASLTKMATAVVHIADALGGFAVLRVGAPGQ